MDEKHTKVLHPYSYNITKHNRSKSHQTNVQQSTQNKSDFNDIRGLYGRVTNTAQEPRGKKATSKGENGNGFVLLACSCLWKFNIVRWSLDVSLRVLWKIDRRMKCLKSFITIFKFNFHPFKDKGLKRVKEIWKTLSHMRKRSIIYRLSNLQHFLALPLILSS